MTDVPERGPGALPADPSPGLLGLDVDLARLGEVRAFVRFRASALGADEEAVGDLVQAVDEWVTNIVRHGYGGGRGPVEVELQRDGPEIVARVRDRGRVFDPADAPPFDPEAVLHRRRPGGMGVYLMHALMGSISHQARPGGGNEVTMRRVGRTAAAGGLA